jgi:hypothetical protein
MVSNSIYIFPLVNIVSAGANTSFTEAYIAQSTLGCREAKLPIRSCKSGGLLFHIKELQMKRTPTKQDTFGPGRKISLKIMLVNFTFLLHAKCSNRYVTSGCQWSTTEMKSQVESMVHELLL